MFLSFEHSGFEFVSDFGFRASDFSVLDFHLLSQKAIET